MNIRQQIIDLAKKCDADLVGFAPASRFDQNNAVFKIFPQTKTVIGLAFRVLRGAYRGIEEGSVYYQYSTMGVEVLEETVMPAALLRVSNLIEESGGIAVPQKRNQQIINADKGTNPEVWHWSVMNGIKAENQLDFLSCAVQCGLGEESMIHSLLTPEFGPFVRYCFILTDLELEGTPLQDKKLCDHCGECVKACHGNAIAEDGQIDCWRCAVYYNGANGSKNPFMPPEGLSKFDREKRMQILNGTAQFEEAEAREILDELYYYPPVQHSYRSSICGRACDRACYVHLEKKGLLTKSFQRPFREHEEWKLDCRMYENYNKKE